MSAEDRLQLLLNQSALTGIEGSLTPRNAIWIY